jgi:protein-tyrosine phosphatase
MIEMTQVWERLFIGDRNDAEHLRESNPFGINSVVSLCEEKIVLRDYRVNYEHFPIADRKPIRVGQFDAVINEITENIRWGTVLIHCDSGMSRAPIMAAAWMDVVGYKNVDAALQEIAGLRPIIAPSKTLVSSVRRHLK